MGVGHCGCVYSILLLFWGYYFCCACVFLFVVNFRCWLFGFLFVGDVCVVNFCVFLFQLFLWGLCMCVGHFCLGFFLLFFKGCTCGFLFVLFWFFKGCTCMFLFVVVFFGFF